MMALEDYNTPSDAFVQSIDVHTLLPQQPPFVMIGRLEHFDLTLVATSLAIEPDNIFVEDSRFAASGLIENVAQTCAARIGYINKYILKKGIQIGFIGAIKNMSVDRLPKIGDTIHTQVTVREEVFGMLLATGAVTCEGSPILTTDIKIAIKE